MRGVFQRNTVGQVTASIACPPPPPPTRQFKVARQHPNPNSTARRKLGYESQCNTDRARSESVDRASRQTNKPSALVAYPIVLPRRRCSPCTRESASAALRAPSQHCNRIASADVRARHSLSLAGKLLHCGTSSGVAAKVTIGRVFGCSERARDACPHSPTRMSLRSLAACTYIQTDARVPPPRTRRMMM